MVILGGWVFLMSKVPHVASSNGWKGSDGNNEDENKSGARNLCHERSQPAWQRSLSLLSSDHDPFKTVTAWPGEAHL